MFDWFDKVFNRRDYPKNEETDIEKIGNDMNKVIPFPTPAAKPAPKECYRVGRRDDGMTTLTVMSGDGFGSITLAMNDAACEQMIKLLRATYDNGTESAS